MTQHDTMRDMSAPLQEDAVDAVYRHMHDWCDRHHLDILLLRQVNNEMVGPHRVRERVAALMYAMDEHYGRQTLDAWWDEEGRALLWDTEKNVPRPEGARLLMHAVLHCQQSLAFWALDHGWSPHTYDTTHRGGLTPLHVCVKAISSKMPGETSYLQLFERLLTPLTVNYQSRPGCEETAIALLVGMGKHWHNDQAYSVQMFERLLKAGADVTLPNQEGWTPLHMVVGRAGLPMLEREALLTRLLKAGANPFAQTKANEYHPPLTPLALLKTPEYRLKAPERQTLTRFLQKAMRQFEAYALTETLDTSGQAPASSSGRPRL